MEAAFAVYSMFWLRKLAIDREVMIVKGAVDRDENNPPAALLRELRPSRAVDVVDQLAGLDYAVNFAYDVLSRRPEPDCLNLAFVSVLCMRIVSGQLHEQKYAIFPPRAIPIGQLTITCRKSGQRYIEFFANLRRPASHKWLFLIYLGLDDRVDYYMTMSKIKTLYLAEAGTDPVMGVVAQGRMMRFLFPGKKIFRIDYRSLPYDLRVALRPPCDIWAIFRTHCLWCGMEADKVCSKCKSARYCGDECQTACVRVKMFAIRESLSYTSRSHWQFAHRPACFIHSSWPKRILEPKAASKKAASTKAASKKAASK